MSDSIPPADTSSEAYRMACEARDWLRKGYTTAAKVDELMTRIAAKRGQVAADALRDEMRRQWPNRKVGQA